MEELSLKEKVDILLEEKRQKEREIYKEKKFRLPFKGRVSKSKVKKGYVSVIVFKDNKNIDIVRKQIIGGTIKLDDGEPISIHSLKQEDLFYYKGKPMLFQSKSNLNPFNPFVQKHETYGQPLVMARMEGDKLSIKKGFGKAGWIISAVIVAVIAYAFMTGS